MIFLYIYFTVSQVISRTHSIFVRADGSLVPPSRAPRAPAPPPPAKQAGPDSEETGRHVVVVLHRFTCSGKKQKTTSIEDINIVFFITYII